MIYIMSTLTCSAGDQLSDLSGMKHNLVQTSHVPIKCKKMSAVTMIQGFAIKEVLQI